MSAFPTPRDSGVVLWEGWAVVSPLKGFIWIPAQPQKVSVTSEQPFLSFSFAFLFYYINEVGGKFLLHRILRFKKAKQSKFRLFMVVAQSAYYTKKINVQEKKQKEIFSLMNKGQIWEINTTFVLHNSFLSMKTEMSAWPSDENIQ